MTGKVRSISGEWSIDDKKSRDTLVPCPVCKGAGHLFVETDDPDHDYVIQNCRWCSGIGGVPKRIYLVYLRWLRIAAINKSRCG